MKIVIGYQAMPTVEGTSVHYKSTTADPVSTCTVSIHDDTSSLSIKEMMELWVLDDTVIPNPSWNLLMAPELQAAESGYWASTATAGFGGTVSFAGAPPVTASVTNDNHIGYALRFQNVQVGLVVPGQEYMLSGYVQINSNMNNAYGILKFGWVDAGGNYLGDVATYYPTTAMARTRASITAIAPSTAVSAQIAFGIGTNAQPTNSGTAYFDTLQFEPVWWPATMSYPTPDIVSGGTNVTTLPNLTYIRQYRKFAGWVNHFSTRDYHGNVRTWDVDAVNFAWIMGTVYTISAFVGHYDSYIINGLLGTYFQSNTNVLLSGLNLFDTTNVIQGSLLADLQPNWDNLRTIFDNLAANAGFFWTVDPYFRMIYEPPGYTQMPIALICDSSANPDFVTTFPGYSVQAEGDFTQPGCSVLVIGGNVSLNLMVGLTHSVSVTTLTVSPVPVYIPINTVMSMGGNQGITLSAAANVGDATLHIFSFNPSADYGVGTNITSNQYVGSVFDPAQSAIYNQQALYGFGIPNNFFIRKINDSTLESVADTINRGIAELLQYDTTRQIYHVTTNVELISGQAIQVTDNQNSLNSTSLLIQSVSANWIGKDETLTDVWEYKADLGNVNRATSSILSHIFRQTSLNTSAPGVNQTSLFALEKFSLVDTADYPYVLAVMADGPLAWYRLSESGGTTAYDSSGNISNGTISVGGVDFGHAGPIAYDPATAIQFDGSVGSVVLPNATSVTGFTILTLEAWFMLSSLPGTARSLFSNASTGSSNTGVNFTVNANGLGMQLQAGDGSGRLTVNLNTYQLQTGVWYYAVGQYISGGTSFVLIQSATDSTPTIKTGSHTGAIASSGANLKIAGNPASGSAFLPATIANAAVYQSALSQTRAAVHYKIGVYGHP